MKKEALIEIIQLDYGCTKKQAKDLIKQMSPKRKELIYQSFCNNAKRSFYDD